MENKIIKLEQVPVIDYKGIEDIKNEVATRMTNLKLDELVVTEENVKEIKQLRTTLKKEFTEYEDVRKLIKDQVMKPYNDFEAKYKEMAVFYTGADNKLKAKINEVEDSLLQIKIDEIKAYFDDVNKNEFISFEDIGLKIIKSKSNKSYCDEIDEYLKGVANDLTTIETLENKSRVLAKYQISKNLNQAISETNIEIEREKAIKQREEEEKQRNLFNAEDVDKKPQEPIKEEIKEAKETTKDAEILEMTFTVVGTIEQLKLVKQFILQNNIEIKEN